MPTATFGGMAILYVYSVDGTRKDCTGFVSDPIFSIVQTLVSPAVR